MTAEELRHLASEATPGPWEAGYATIHRRGGSPYWTIQANYEPWPLICRSYVSTSRASDAAYIAAANPQAITVLLNRLDRLEAIADGAVKHGCPPDAQMDSSPAGQNLRNWWLNKWAPIREQARAILAEREPTMEERAARDHAKINRMRGGLHLNSEKESQP